MSQTDKRRTIIFVNRFFYPDYAATSQLLTDLAVYLVQQGHGVYVITSRQRYEDANVPLASREDWRGVSIYRVWSTRFGRANLAGRTVDYLSFYLGAAWTLARTTNHETVIVAKTDPPMLSFIGALVAKLHNATLVNWLQDLFPEVAVGLLLSSKHKTLWQKLQRLLFAWIFKFLQRLRDWSLLGAQCNVVIGELMRQRLLCTLRDPSIAERIRVIHNWADGQTIKPMDAAVNPLRKQWQLGNKFVVAYSGNLGRAHDIVTLLQAIELLRNDTDIVFLFIGAGAHINNMHEECVRRRLSNVIFKPYQARAQLPLSLCVADVHLVSLLPQMEGLIVPSKFYGVIAAGRPCLFIGAENGEIATLLNTAECGFTVKVGDAEGMANTIRILANDPKLSMRLGNNGRIYFQQHFEQTLALQAWDALLTEVN